MKNHILNYVKSQELSYRPIYNEKLVKLEIFKIYIQTNLVNNSFIMIFKSPIGICILFSKKLNKTFGYISIIMISITLISICYLLFISF